MEIMPCILSHHNSLKLGINYKIKNKIISDIWKLNNTQLNDEWIVEETKDEILRGK